MERILSIQGIAYFLWDHGLRMHRHLHSSQRRQLHHPFEISYLCLWPSWCPNTRPTCTPTQSASPTVHIPIVAYSSSGSVTSCRLLPRLASVVYLPCLALPLWSAFVALLLWSTFVALPLWSAFVTLPLWSTFVALLLWSAFVALPLWSTFVALLLWSAFVALPLVYSPLVYFRCLASVVCFRCLATGLLATVIMFLSWCVCACIG
jgi:hypothetical protein